MKKLKPAKPYWEMTTRELAEATKEFDRPIPFSQTRPLSRNERKEFERSRRLPTVSIFVSRRRDHGWVNVNLDPDVLARAQKYAAKRKMSLSEFVNRSLKGLLNVVE